MKVHQELLRRRDLPAIAISAQTRTKAEVAKRYIENKYYRLKQEEIDRKRDFQSLEEVMTALRLSAEEKMLIKEDVFHREAEALRASRSSTSIFDFEPINIIGRGAFGEVRIVRFKPTQEIMALKKMKKTEMIYKNQVTHVHAERNALAAASSPWIVTLHTSFQDSEHLYLAMEFLPGGDLMSLLMKRNTLLEYEARFYAAEITLAIESVHAMHYVHRDVKPDNILVSASGHIKLSDFGLCRHAGDFSAPDAEVRTSSEQVQYRRSRQLAYSTVGTPDYIAPEVFAKVGYTETVDWWSLGIILFEMLAGYPPFFSDNAAMTCQKIAQWKRTLIFPREVVMSADAEDLIKRLLCDAENRLGVNGVEEIKQHPFFRKISWSDILTITPPFVPELNGEADCCNFEEFEEIEPFYPPSGKGKTHRREDGSFIGFGFSRSFIDPKRSIRSTLSALELRRAATVQVSTSGTDLE